MGRERDKRKGQEKGTSLELAVNRKHEQASPAFLAVKLLFHT